MLKLIQDFVKLAVFNQIMVAQNIRCGTLALGAKVGFIYALMPLVKKLKSDISVGICLYKIDANSGKIFFPDMKYISLTSDFGVRRADH